MTHIHLEARRKMGIIILVSVLLTGVILKLNAASVVAVFLGILTIFWVLIQLHEHFNKAKQNA